MIRLFKVGAILAVGGLNVHGTCCSAFGGVMSVDCRESGGWTLAQRVSASDPSGVETLTVTMTNAACAKTPAFTVRVKQRQGDSQVRWHTDAWYPNLRPDWRDKAQSSFLSGLPVHALATTTDRNRLTVAADDCFGFKTCSCGNDERGLVTATWSVPEGAAFGTSAVFRFRADRRDIRWSDAVREASDWVRGFCTPAVVPEAAAAPVYSTWYAYHTDVDAKRMEQEAARAAALGMKSFFMDAGWYMDGPDDFGPYAGDWTPSAKRFPDFAAHVARVKATGLRYVLWYGMPLAGYRTAAHERFKGKFLSEHKGLKASILDPRFPECREYMIATMERALREWGVDGFKIDFIYSMGAAGAPAKPGDGRDIADARVALRQLLADMHRRVMAIRPDALIEFQHGHGNPAMQTYCNILRVGDCAGDITENRSAIARMRLFSGALAVHSDMLVWDAGDAPENAARQVLATLFGTTQFSVGLARTPSAHRKMMAHWIRFMTEHGNALRKGEFRPCHPEANYPLVEGEDGTEVVSAVYLQGFPVRIAAGKRHFAVNATGDGELVVESVREAKAVVFDTFGERKGEVLLKPGLQKVAVPVCGYLSVAEPAGTVSDAEMNAIYEKVNAPYKYGVVMEPEDGHMVDNPCVFAKDGKWFMVYIDFDGKGYETRLAESEDLLEWHPLGCIVRRGKGNDWDRAQADAWPVLLDCDWNGSNELQRFNGRYWGMYIGGANEGYEADPLRTGVVWTDDPSVAKPWTKHPGPVLGPDDEDARWFERKTIYRHFIVEDPERSQGGRFVSFYNAKEDLPMTERIGMAISDDLLHWKRVGTEPIIDDIGKGRGISGDPMIRRIGDVWVMFYFGFMWKQGVNGAFETFAASRNLRDWVKWKGKPLIEPSEKWDCKHAHKPWVICHDGVVYHFYCAVGEKGRAIALATSKELVR